MTEKTIKIKGIEKLLDEQTSVILSAVDEKLGTNKIEIVSSIDQKLAKMETRMSQKFDKLITTLFFIFSRNIYFIPIFRRGFSRGGQRALAL